MADYLSLVNPLQGTASVFDFSTGDTLPLAAMPWGMHHWTIQTVQNPWRFHPDHRKVQGIRLTHQPSPWMKDYGSLLVAPFSGHASGDLEQQSSSWKISEAEVRPDFLRLELLRYQLIIEMAPSNRGAIFEFHSRSSAGLRVRLAFDVGHEIVWQKGQKHFIGISRDHSGGVEGDFGLRFYGEFDVAPEEIIRLDDGAYWTFSPGAPRVTLRLAASFLSHEIAQGALRRELVGRDVRSLSAETAQTWNDLLGRFSITPENEDQERTFYSCLYRCLLFPRLLDEIDEDGNTVHFSPYDGNKHPGSLCADNGFWDTYRTVYPLLALAYPDKLQVILEGWLNACREGGWSPKWASPGYRDSMIGTHFDAVVADAIAKGVTNWNVEDAFTYLWKNASEPSTDGRFGRCGLDDYIHLGYVPADRIPYAVSRTLDFAYGDFCVAQVANHLGKGKESELLLLRSRNYRNIFDEKIGFMRPRLSDGTWVHPFCEFEWGGAYIEGGPWQHLFNVPHDPHGLARLLGGQSALCEKLDKMLATPPLFERGSYEYEIHEMTEMALAPFGQYAHSNQPVHNSLFFYSLFGHPEKTTHWVHRVARELYTPDSFPGDEDNGEMSAWYIFACLGIYPFCAGTPEYVRFESLLPSAKIFSPQSSDPISLSRQIFHPARGATIEHSRLMTGATTNL